MHRLRAVIRSLWRTWTGRSRPSRRRLRAPFISSSAHSSTTVSTRTCGSSTCALWCARSYSAFFWYTKSSHYFLTSLCLLVYNLSFILCTIYLYSYGSVHTRFYRKLSWKAAILRLFRFANEPFVTVQRARTSGFSISGSLKRTSVNTKLWKVSYV